MQATAALVRRRVAKTVALLPWFLLVALAGLTFAERDYLRDHQWSPIGRTDTQWPSILGTGNHGWIFVVTMTVTATAYGALTWLVATAPGLSGRRVQVLSSGLITVGLVLVCLPADPPGVAVTSWHATIHNNGYPLVPLGALLGLAAACVGPVGRLRVVARTLLPVAAVAFGLTATNEIGQLARYVAFASIGVWVAVLAGCYQVLNGAASLTRKPVRDVHEKASSKRRP